MKVKHGLPEKVQYCKLCVMSNQRPATSREFSKSKTSDTPSSSFGDDGICDACKFNLLKRTFDWNDRNKQLRELCDKHRGDGTNYDVLVPGSGGKDSIYVSHILQHEFGMKPLTVTWAPHSYTTIGHTNHEAWVNTGVDNILFTPNAMLHRRLTRNAFINLVNPFQPFIIGQKVLAPKLALKFGINLIMYGENQAEAHNDLASAMNPLMDPSHFTYQNRSENIYLGGINLNEYLDSKEFSLADFQPYLPINRDLIEEKNIQIHFMSYYKNWSPQENYYYVKENSTFESNPDGRSEGTYTKYSSLDDKVDGQHYFTSLVKFGQGRAMNDACRDIRDGFITREEGVQLVNQYDTEFPKKYFDFFLKYISTDKEQYWDVIEDARSEHIWKKEGQNWKLRNPLE